MKRKWNMDKESVDNLRMSWAMQRDEIALELKAMGQSVEDISFSPFENCTDYGEDKSLPIWNNNLSDQEQSATKFVQHKRHLLRLAYAINQYAQINLECGNFSKVIYHLDEAVFILSRAYKIQDNAASIKAAKSIIGKDAANKRHELTYQLRNEVVAYWNDNIFPENPKLSNEKAAEQLQKIFPKFSVRKLAEYVSKAKAEKKKLPPAGKV